VTLSAFSQRIRRLLPGILIVILLLLALAARIWGAWTLRFSTDSDTGIVYLMVRHMLDGASWPVFFYGQAYMGNVEPAFSAALCALGHYSPFQVNLGTALLGWMALLVLARWARDATGRDGAAWALLIAFIGPPTFYGFQVSLRGGYAVTVLLGSLLVWWICRITLDERRTRQIRFRSFFFWGLLAGLGWWANSLILPALLTAALVIFFGVGRSLWNPRRLLMGGVGFFAGSAPFWIWSYQHHGDSLAIFNNLDPVAFSRRGIDLVTQRLPDFFEFPQAGSPFWYLGILLVLLPPLIAILAAFRARKKPEMIYIWAAVLQTTLTLACYCATRFADTGLVRYLVPLFIPWALLTAAALKAVAQRTHVAVAWILALLLSAGYFHALLDFGEKSSRDAQCHAQARKLQEFCQHQNLSTVFAGFRHHWLNAALGEHPIFITLAGERLLPNARQGEFNSSPAFLNNAGEIDEFLLQSGGSCQRSAISGSDWALYWSFTSPPDSPILAGDSSIEFIRNNRSADLLSPLTDLNLDTTCVLGDSLEPETWIIHFREPVSLTGLRLYLDPPDGQPPPLSLEVLSAPDASWQPLLTEIWPTHYFWSGPRPYWGGRSFHFDLRWPVMKMSSLKIRFTPQSHPTLVYVAELQFLTASSPPTGISRALQEQSLQELFNLIRDRNPTLVYADRWVSARLADPHLPPLRRLEEPTIGWNGGPVERPVVKWTPDTLLVVARDQAPITDRLLTASSITMRQTPLGPWVIFDFTPLEWRREFKQICHFSWTGQGILRNNADHEKPPTAPPALATPIRFRNGARLVGVSPASPIRAKAGSLFHLRYFWECPPKVNPHAFAVFAHFDSGSALFQDDHLWLAPFRISEIRSQSLANIYSVDREIPIPTDLPSGTYRLQLGLLDSQTLKRVPCKSDFQVRHAAVDLPLEIIVSTP